MHYHIVLCYSTIEYRVLLEVSAPNHEMQIDLQSQAPVKQVCLTRKLKLLSWLKCGSSVLVVPEMALDCRTDG